MSHSRRNGFTLVELLVVISIIGMLMALLLPAVGAATENARSMRCKNRLKQIATAMASYESRFERFPGYVNGIEVGSEARSIPWLVELMPDMERTDLLDVYKSAEFRPANAYQLTDPGRGPMLDFLMCPSDPPLGEDSHTSYVVNAGFAEGDLAGCGMVHSRSPVRYTSGPKKGQKVVHIESSLDKLAAGDGASNTLMITENVQASRWTDIAFHKSKESPFSPMNVFLWHNVVNPTGQQEEMLINSDMGSNFDVSSSRVNTTRALYSARPSSVHKGGVNAAFGDGHVVFLKDGIDYSVYARLMSTDGKKCHKEFYLNAGSEANINHQLPVTDTDYK